MCGDQDFQKPNSSVFLKNDFFLKENTAHLPILVSRSFVSEKLGIETNWRKCVSFDVKSSEMDMNLNHTFFTQLCRLKWSWDNLLLQLQASSKASFCHSSVCRLWTGTIGRMRRAFKWYLCEQFIILVRCLLFVQHFIMENF